MADPLSFIASVIAVASLSEKVVIKGYHYLRAVKNCPDEVRSLVAELNVLCGILGRLKVLLENDKSKLVVATNSDDREGLDLDEKSDEEEIVDSDDENSTAHDNALHPPDFIYACQRTLNEIEDVLRKFERTSVESTQTTVKASRFNVSSLRRLEAKDLKWPLRKSKTMELIEALERHKSTCTLALAENSLLGVHTILEQTNFTNKCLAQLKEKQEKLLELSITHEQEAALAWLSPVNPALKLQEFRRERQRGTGIWLFDLPEMTAWLENSNSALWIYGIPGAGKTMLSTLVVDEVLTRKRSSSIGTAYFYVRHDDRNSQVPSNVLGSLISQLARQNSEALDDVVELHTQHLREGSLATTLDDDELLKHFSSISRNFKDTFIMIDGLDECGSVYDRDRKRLIDDVAGIHRSTNNRVNTLIFSRDELDIRTRLTATEFQIVSIAAKSADLRLYVNAWLPSLEIQSETLKVEVIDTLVDGANGMFMWVRAQVDYLQRLPNDAEKQKALKMLPPDLPQTYIRIFEIIDSTYSPQTVKFVQRLLKWLVFQHDGVCLIYGFIDIPKLTLHTLRQAICIENENYRLLDAELPTVQQILGWLGCLVRRSNSQDVVELSHFTIKEFLRMDPENASSSVAQKYLVKPKDRNYLLKVCLIQLMHDDFKNITCSTAGEVQSLVDNHPLYGYATVALCNHIDELVEISLDSEVKRIIQKFLSMPVCESFQLWDTCIMGRHILEMEDSSAENPEIVGNALSPLHFASMLGLTEEVQRLLKLGFDPNCSSLPIEDEVFFLTPLHLALCSGNIHGDFEIKKGTICLTTYDSNLYDDNHLDFRKEQRLIIFKILLNAGVNVDQQLVVEFESEDYEFDFFKAKVTPLVLAIIIGFPRAASILLGCGANLDATADENSLGMTDLCSVGKLLGRIPEFENNVQRVVDLDGNQGLKKALEEHWQSFQDTDDYDDKSTEGTASDNQSAEEITSDDTNPQKLFIDAYQNEDWPAVREMLNADSGIELNCNDEQGTNSIYYASSSDSNELLYILEQGADPNLLTTAGCSALCRAVKKGCLENINLLLKFSAEIEHRDPSGWTPFLYAVWSHRQDILKLLLEKGANADALLDDGRNGIHLAIEQKNTNIFSLLLERKINTILTETYGSTPLNYTCKSDLQFEAEKLIETTPELSDRINDDSLIYGTPLYAAAEYGSISTVQKLLDAGASIDKTGPGNILGSALMIACANGHCEIAKLLLSRGASLEVEGSRFLSAAGTARTFRKEAIIKILEAHAGTIHEIEDKTSQHGAG